MSPSTHHERKSVDEVRIALILLFITIFVNLAIGFHFSTRTPTALAPAFVAMTCDFLKRRVALSFIAVGILALAVMYPASEYQRSYMLAPSFRFTAEVVLHAGSSASELREFVQGRGLGE